MMNHPGSGPLFEQQRWATAMGPDLMGQRRWLMDNAHRYDIVVFMTYLYATTTNGLPTVAGRVPTILQPTAHDEPPAYVSLYQSIFRQPDAFLFFTPEEREVVKRIYNIEPDGNTIGIGIDLEVSDGVGSRFREQFGIGESPYLIYVGRLDGSKGVGELCRFFLAMKKRKQSDLKLVLAGGGDLKIPDSADIVSTGFLDEQQKRDAIAGALALVQPSYFESFSIVLCESWLQKRPALVQGKCEVLRGQSMRSNGSIPFEGFAEFEAAVEYLQAHPETANAMGESGYQYVKDNYDWDVVVGRFEETIALAQRNFSQRKYRFTLSR
jgi:glycosyltransferase involved in cell wall biosynthesis